jgi:hypothetical protein
MTKTIQIWGRKMEIEIRYESYPNDPVIAEQQIAAKMILDNPDIFNDALDDVKTYCKENCNNMIQETAIENVFQYVLPEALYVEQNREKRSVALMCNYKFDEEHGIAVVFENEHFVQVGPQDIIL